MIRKKFLMSMLIGLLVLTSVGGVLAKDIAYIAKDSGHVDSNIVSLLDNGGYSYDVIYQTALDSTDFSNYSIILVGEGIFTDPSKVPVNTKNSVILNTYHMDEWGWSGNGVSTKSSNFPIAVTVFDNRSSITDGVSEFFVPYTKSSDVILSYDIKYLSKLEDAPGLTTIVADDKYFLHIFEMNTPTNGAVVAIMNNGSLLRNNQVSHARGVFLGFPLTNLWTDQTKRIFYNSIDWAISGEDRDLDGFFTDQDCNDDDYDINPNATEVPYNHLDENCDGYDLADLDQDQYCKLGYAIENATLQCPEETGSVGTDCNDNDSEYNPGSSDLKKNCVNDAPVIQTINRITIYENETANLHINAEDSENDNITYSVNDSRFVQDPLDKTHFSWLTNFTDAGSGDYFIYTFFVTASDGKLSSTEKFTVKVQSRNKAPDLLANIPTQEWNEDTNHTLDLSQYFSDIDGDNLTYLFIDTSGDTNIHISKLSNNIIYFEANKDWYGEDWIIFGAADKIHITNTNNITLRVLPVNDAPILLKEIGTVDMEEDTPYNVNLSQYFKDVDSVLNYTFHNTTNTTLSLNGNILTITPQANWHGEDDASIKASDGQYDLTDDFTINVNSVNDAPVVAPLAEKYVLAGEKVSITPSATDIEGDPFNFSMNDSRFVQNGSNFEWQTGEKDFGIYDFKVIANDGMDSGYNTVKINVIQKIFINEMVWGNEGWIELYNPENTSFDLQGCTITNGDEDLVLYGPLGSKGYAVFGWNALKNEGAIELSCDGVLIDTVEYTAFNLANSYGRRTDGSLAPLVIFDFPTKGVSNSADVTKPEVTLDSPNNNTLYTETRDVLFKFTGKDNMAETLTCSLVANLKTLETESFDNDTQGSFFIDYLPDGVYTWNVECSDGTNKNSAENPLVINISAPDAPTLSYIGNKVVSENTLLRFPIFATDQDNDKITLTTEDMPEGASFTDNKIGNGVFLWTPNYNQSGTYNVKFTATDSTGLEDSETITILVGNAKEPPKFSDADVCASKNGSIDLTIKDPSKGDDFDVGSTINGTVRIRNKFTDSRDFDVHVYLYDLKEEKAVDEYDDTVSVSDGDYEDMDFTLDIPSDTENKDFAVYAYVEGDENECNSNYVAINVNRKKHDLEINDITTDKDSVYPGDQLGVEIGVDNLGKNKEDVSIVLTIPALGITQTSEKFTLEKYGGKDSKKETMYVTIPEDAKIGTYDVKASVSFSGGESSQQAEFEVATVGNAGVVNSDTINLNPNANSNSNSNSGGTHLVVGDSTTGSGITSGNGGAIVINHPSSTTSTTKKSLFNIKTVNLGVKEQNQKEYIPNVKVAFGANAGATNNSKLILLAVILGLLIVGIFILIVLVR